MIEIPKPLIEATVEKDAAGLEYYTQGDVRFPFNAESLSVTLDLVDKLNELAHRRIMINSGFKDHEDLEPEYVQKMARACVQHVWYQVVRKTIPDGVVKHHRERTAQHERALKDAEAAPAERAKKATKAKDAPASHAVRRWALDPKVKAPEFGAQAQLVYDALKAGDATIAELTARVDKTKALKTRQPTDRVVAFYVNQFNRQKLVFQLGATPTKKGGE